MALKQERKRLSMLDIFKAVEGPFTDAGEVEAFLKDKNLGIDIKEQQKRMKTGI